MDLRHPTDAAITLSFDEGVWEADTAPAARAAPFVGGMGGVPIAAAPGAGSVDPDFDWLLQQLSGAPGVSMRLLPPLLRRPGASARALDAAVTPTVTVDLAAGESAVLLVECEGVVAWQLPEDDPAAPARGAARAVVPRKVRFSVQAPGAATAATPQQRNVLSDWLLDRVKSVVLKFAASHAAGAIVARLEKDKRTGPVVISPDAEPQDWLRPDDFTAVRLPPGKARVLLLVHGTFSSTSGGFGELRATKWGRAFLKEASEQYGAILGFDHRTLSVDPHENASRLHAALRTLRPQEQATIDIVCHSRGALVTRCLIEQVLPLADVQPKIGRVVFVGATNAGTELARPENWHALMDLVTNLALAGRRALAFMGAPQAGVVAGELVQGVADFVRYLVDAAVEDRRAPGLAAMDPDGPFVSRINSVEPGAPTAAAAQYYSVTSNFRPVLVDAQRHEPKEFPRRLALMLANGFIGALMKKAQNDLVVNVGSMSTIDPVAGKYIKGVQDFGTNPLVYHTNYFLQPETVDAVAGWLGLGRVQAVEYDVPVAVIPSAGAALDVLKRAAGAEAPDDSSTRAFEASPAPSGAEAPAAGEAAPARAEPVVCNVQAEMPPKVVVGATVAVTVTLSADAIVATPGALTASAPVTMKRAPVTIEVLPRVGFRLQGSAIDDSRVTLPEPPAPGSPCIIDVNVVATDEGPGEIWAIVRQGPVRSATLVLRPQVVAGAPVTPSAAPLASQASIQAGDDLPAVPTLEITQQRNGSETRFIYRVSVPGEVFNRFESPPITGDLAAWVKTLYQSIEGAWLGSAGNRDIFHDQLQARGASLFRELIPPVLARLLWKLHGQGKLGSVLVNSDEPFVPWEIAYLQDPDAAGGAGGCFFGQLGLCRWLFGAVPATRIRVRPGRMRYVVPHYPEARYTLQAAEQTEEPMLVAMGAQKIVPHYREVTAALGSGEFDLLHFAGHGGADGANIAEAAVLLEGSYQPVGGGQGYVTEPLAATVVAQKARLCGPDRNRPLVVLNACQVSRLGFNLTSLGGFAPAFLGARVGESSDIAQAGAFVSSLWAVGDQPASVFAQAFYQALQVDGGTTIARAVTAAREAARAAGDATWLAYAVYAHPACHVEFTP